MGGRRDSPLLCLIMSEDEKEQDTEEPTSEELATGEQVENDTSPIEAEGSEEAEESEESVDEFDDEAEEVEFDLEAQVEEFRNQIEEDPDNCVHFYNLGEALAELGQLDEAHESFDQALLLDDSRSFSAIIHFGIGNLFYHQLMSGIQSTVVKSSVGLHSQHRAGTTIISVNDDDYAIPLRSFEASLQDLPTLQADEEIMEYISKHVPQQIATVYYKWASDLFDKARQIEKYGGEVQDIKQGLKHLKKAVDIDPNHTQANLMVKYGKKMLQEGFSIYDEYGFEAKEIPGTG
ncbi:MAG: tetratricopeptide repeat protein [Nitrospina sp.]|jgi:tetratricopeptide (TPR) repeat protein|nr:tetratricopeptide repeat protein [Nitrospina sp.]MBT3511030.1 tetratricopeptide repeat protein [Nitrospina sp.]MBT3876976.1 tetratricopeptide repeat protein [Nitrospina sp.]MBT4047714.1 tetratricopeptide repeat protein [Nitrospina sp.]MBT4557811.1 tetratricopeptide repeat protein [Nitrospina sp.]